MGIATFPAPSAASKTRYVVTLTSGTSWTVPAGVTYVNAKLVGGGGGGSEQGNYNSNDGSSANPGCGGEIVESNVSTTPGSSISYAIGAGSGGDGGTTTFTGATSALGGKGGGGGSFNGRAGTNYLSASNGGNSAFAWSGNNRSGGSGGSGCIILEYWI